MTSYSKKKNYIGLAFREILWFTQTDRHRSWYFYAKKLHLENPSHLSIYLGLATIYLSLVQQAFQILLLQTRENWLSHSLMSSQVQLFYLYIFVSTESCLQYDVPYNSKKKKQFTAKNQIFFIKIEFGSTSAGATRAQNGRANYIVADTDYSTYSLVYSCTQIWFTSKGEYINR